MILGRTCNGKKQDTFKHHSHHYNDVGDDDDDGGDEDEELAGEITLVLIKT